jgi:hypothetical protein
LSDSLIGHSLFSPDTRRADTLQHNGRILALCFLMTIILHFFLSSSCRNNQCFQNILLGYLSLSAACSPALYSRGEPRLTFFFFLPNFPCSGVFPYLPIGYTTGDMQNHKRVCFRTHTYLKHCSVAEDMQLVFAND